jgi:hypothetical protein
MIKAIYAKHTDHFVRVDFFLDLLGKHWGQTVASMHVAPTVIFSTWPGIVELNVRAEGGTSLASWTG